MKLKKRNPNNPEVTQRVLERLKQMSSEQIDAMLKWRPEDVIETNMNEPTSALSAEEPYADDKRQNRVA